MKRSFWKAALVCGAVATVCGLSELTTASVLGCGIAQQETQEKGAQGQEIAREEKAAEGEVVRGKTPEEQERFDRFTKMMNNVKLVGQFTIEGSKEDKLLKDEYTVTGVEKLPDGDYWKITARIKYGSFDVTVPVPVEVKWAGNTPVITLDNIAIPGLGTFSSRVLLDKGKYAGTWTHDNNGGVMFGVIRPIEETKPNEEAKKETKKD